MEILSKLYEDLLGLMTTGTTITTADAIINMVLSAIFSYLVYIVYVKFGKSTNNRKHFGNTFLLMTVCTTLIIGIVRSSVTLSLGLVGALSIVRFRTAVKDPEELTHLFLCIAIGLGFGANERLVTSIGCLFLLMILVVRSKLTKSITQEYYNLSIHSALLNMEQLLKLIQPHCKDLNLRRFDEQNNEVDVLFNVDITNHEQLQRLINAVKSEDQQASISFIENRSY